MKIQLCTDFIFTPHSGFWRFMEAIVSSKKWKIRKKEKSVNVRIPNIQTQSSSTNKVLGSSLGSLVKCAGQILGTNIYRHISSTCIYLRYLHWLWVFAQSRGEPGRYSRLLTITNGRLAPGEPLSKCWSLRRKLHRRHQTASVIGFLRAWSTALVDEPD